MSMSRKILFLTKYAELGASSRHRAYQFLPLLHEANILFDIKPLFPDDYLSNLYTGARAAYGKLVRELVAVRALASRWWLILHSLSDYDVIYLEYEALPYLPFAVEKQLFTSARCVVVDYDDAIYANYEYHRNPFVRWLLGTKIREIVKQSAFVIVANNHLAQWTLRLNPNVHVIPTCVDLRHYPLRSTRFTQNDRPVIGWIGTPITAKHLRILEKPLKALRRRYDFTLKVIGAPGFTLDGVDVRAIAWNAGSEYEELHGCDIGVMPLPDDPWTRGKSAFKLIQYLAAGVVGVASPVGANCEVIQDGQNGMLAQSERDWLEKLSLLIESPFQRKQLAQAGRRTVELGYSLQANAPRWLEVLRRALDQN